MKLIQHFRHVIGTALLGVVCATAAVADQESFIATGTGHNYAHWPEGQEVNYFAVLFEVEVSYDSDSPFRPYSSGLANFHWWDQSLSFDLKVYDLDGQMIDHQVIGPLSISTFNHFPAAFMFSDDGASIKNFGFRIPEIPGLTNFSASITWFPSPQSLPFAPTYPDWQWSTVVGTGNTFSMSRGGLTPVAGDFRFTGFVSSFGSGGDTDGDGVAQGLDSCPESDLSPTVVFNGVDSGVDNVLDADGCTLADKLADAVSDTRNHGQMVRAAGAFLNDLVREGLLSGQQRGALLNAIAQTNK